MLKKGLDERQEQKRNLIGSQTFTLLLYLLMLDVCLYGAGLKWLSYPLNIIIIVLLCSGIYVFRVIAANAFVGPSSKSQKVLPKVVFVMFLAVLVPAAFLVMMKNVGFTGTGHRGEISAPVLFITAGVAILICAVTFFVNNRIQNRDEE